MQFLFLSRLALDVFVLVYGPCALLRVSTKIALFIVLGPSSIWAHSLRGACFPKTQDGLENFAT